MNTNEHKPVGGESGKKKEGFVPFYQAPSYGEKVGTYQALKELARKEEDIMLNTKPSLKEGVTPAEAAAEAAQKIERARIRLQRFRAELDKLEGKSPSPPN